MLHAEVTDRELSFADKLSLQTFEKICHIFTFTSDMKISSTDLKIFTSRSSLQNCNEYLTLPGGVDSVLEAVSQHT